jgi:hypothetical protein
MLLHAMSAAGTFYRQCGRSGFTVISDQGARVSLVEDLQMPQAHRDQLAMSMMQEGDAFQWFGHSKDGKMHVFKVETSRCLEIADTGVPIVEGADPELP